MMMMMTMIIIKEELMVLGHGTDSKMPQALAIAIEKSHRDLKPDRLRITRDYSI